MTSAPAQPKKKGGRRRMKQMQGLLMLARLDEAARHGHGHHGAKARAAKPQRVNVVLQPQLLELAYSALADQDMQHVLGRIDLRGAKLEQVPDGFVIHEAGAGSHKKFKLQDKDKATTDAWFFAVYTAITEYVRLPISASEDVGHKFSAVLTSSLRDEATEIVEFELSCQLVLPLRPIEKPSIKWKVWKTFAELQTFDDELRVSFGGLMKQIMFPRDRKRDSLFGGMRKKSLQELKEQQLALYVEQVFQMPEISVDPVLVDKVKRFLGFDSFFEIVGETDEAVEEPKAALATSEEPEKAQHSAGTVESPEGSSVSEAAPTIEAHDTNADSFVSDGHTDSYPPYEQPPNQYSSNESTGSTAGRPFLSRRRSSATLEDEGKEFVEVIPENDPKAAKKLHKKIIQTVRELVAYDEERVQDFQDQTKDFGRNKTSAMEYCAFLLGAVGAQECCNLIPEMAKLLPDADKRNELLLARASIWRRTHRRNRRRSKQFSESVVLQKQKEEQQQQDMSHSRMRPKSESIGATNWDTERSSALKVPGRSSMIETTSLSIDREFATRSSESDAIATPAYRAGLADPRRHLNRRASFNLFGETLQTEPIQEENPAENESESDDESDDSLLDHPRTSSKEVGSVERRLSLGGNAWTKPSDRRNSSFIDENEDEASVEDESEYVRSRRNRHRHQNGSSSSSIGQRTVKERPLSRDGLTRTRSARRNSSFMSEDEEQDERQEPEDSRTRFRTNQRRASRKFDEETKAKTMSEEEENPVLARLKKQGAINFMMH